MFTCRMDHLGKTVTVQTPPELRRLTQANVLPGILVNLGKEAVHSIQFLPGGSFRASFSSPEHKVRIESNGRFNIGSHECVVQATGPPQVDVYVHYYPFEAPDADIRSVLFKFGQIKGLRYQSFQRYSNVKTGSSIVRMVVEREIPFQQSIRSYPCRVWYKGQPIRCNICREVGHLAASCPNKGLAVQRAWAHRGTVHKSLEHCSSFGSGCDRTIFIWGLPGCARFPFEARRRLRARSSG